MQNCNNNCEAVAGLNEAAANLIQYRNLINTWLNGGQNVTVNIGGVNIPSLLGLAMSIKQLVGVWPDNETIRICADKKIYVPLKTNGGVKVDSHGLYIDSSDFLQLGGGLAKDPATGQIYVDFSAMPTDKFENLLKALHLPIWLSANKNFYVDKNHAQASDAIVEGRGQSANLPFKSIQPCVNYVADNYNLGNYNVYINISPATYEEYLQIGSYQSTGGTIHLQSASETQKFVMRGIYPNSNGVINLHNAKIEYANSARPGSSGYQAISANSYINLYGVEIDTKTGTTHNKRLLQANTGGTIVLRSGTVLKGECYSAMETQGGDISIFSDVTVNNVVMSMAFAFANGSGQIGVTNVGNGVPVITGSATGYRYRISGNGRISTGGQGENYFPGTIAGVISPDNKYS